MFNISNKHEEFFDYLINNAEIFHKGALLAQGAMKDPTLLHLPVSTTHVVSGSIFSFPFQRIVYNRAWKGWR